MRILLTGSSGWLGRFLAPRLRATGYAVIGLDIAPGVDTAVIGSVADKALVERVFAEHGIEAVIHAGALHKPDIVRYPESAFHAVNVEGTRNLLEAAVAAGNDRFLFTSTTSLMISESIRAGALGAAIWLDEESPPAPRNIYGVTKLAAEALCRKFHGAHGIDIAILRTGAFFPKRTNPSRAFRAHTSQQFITRRRTVRKPPRRMSSRGKAPGPVRDFLISRAALYGGCGELSPTRRGVARDFPDAAALQRSRLVAARRTRVYEPSKAEG